MKLSTMSANCWLTLRLLLIFSSMMEPYPNPRPMANDGQDGDGGQYGGVGQGRSVAVQMLGQVAFSREHQFAEGVECIFFDR